MLRFNMHSFYAKTKLFIPALRPQLVNRTNLLEKMDLASRSHHRLILACAPAGFGKTTLIRAWLETIPAPVAWVSLDPNDQNPRQFINYLINAISLALPDLAMPLENITQTTPLPPAEFVLTLMINEITEAHQPLVIVLDDYHHIESEISNQYLTLLLDHLPATATLVITTRSLPALPLARLRARNQITELLTEDLRFTPDESTAFFQQVCGMNLPDELIAELDQQTEGWVAGLQLAAMSLQGTSDYSKVRQKLSSGNTLILNYLADEVLSDQPDSLRDFLLMTSILEQFSVPLAAAILDEPLSDAQAALNTLERKNLFIFPLDQEGQWFHYHPLFASLLRQQLEETRPGVAQQRHERASAWFEQQGMIEMAVRHSLSAGNQTRAIQLTESHAESLLMAGKYLQFLALVDTLSPELRDQSPAILVYQATAMLFNEHPRQEILEVLEKAQSLESANVWMGEIHAIQAIILSYACAPEKGIQLSKSALEKLNPDHLFFRNIIERNLGIAYTLMNDIENANHWFEKLLLSSARLGDWGGMLAAYNYLTYLRRTQGRLKEAAVIYRKALSFIEEKQLALMPHSIKIISGYGYLLLDWGQGEEAKNAFKRAIQLAQKTDVLYAHSAYQNLSEALIRENDLRSALSTIQELRHLAQGRQDFHRQIHNQHTVALEARIHLEAGRLELAYAWLISMGFDLYTMEELLARYGFELGYILPVAARIYLAKGETGRAIQILKDIIPKFNHLGANAFLIRAFSLLAVAYTKDEQPEKAQKALTKALYLAEPEDNLGDFMFAGTALISLLYDCQKAGIFPTFVNHLLQVLAEQESTRKAPSPELSLSDPLSHREMDVLQLIAQGMTNREIAARLFLSTNTIKSHSIKIYRKLSVNNRNQAVSKARLLGILPAHATSNNAGYQNHQT